ncbi:MAG: hypothetical protein AAGB51_10850 [Planctomycetota bacterium]
MTRSAAAVALAAGLSWPAGAEIAPDPLQISGRDFAGLPLDEAARSGQIELFAREARVWDDQSPDGPVRRVLLVGDVELILGDSRFRCRRAALWLQRVAGEQGETYRVFAYLGEVGDPRADAAVGVEADRLPVEGVVRATNGVVLRVDGIERGRPVSGFVAEGERAFAAVLRARSGAPGWATRARLLLEGEDAGDIDPGPVPEPEQPELDEETRRAIIEGLGRRLGDPEAPIFSPEGTIALDAQDLVFTGAQSGSAVIASGGVTLQYWNPIDGEQLDLTAQRAVVFVEPGRIADGARFVARDVLGVYLEGGVVASDGSYTVRSPKVYYDVQENRALLLDSVFWTYDRRRAMPLYLRAEAIRQRSARRFEADEAMVANTSFFKPHFRLGVDNVTVTVNDDEPSTPTPDEVRVPVGTRTLVDARGLTLQAGGFPFAYWPIYRGDPERFPLRDFSFASGQGSGAGIRTSWNTETLLGFSSGDGFDAETLVDYYERRGLGLGQRLDWTTDLGEGDLLAYWLPNDDGVDITPRGVELDANGDSRGLLLASKQGRIGSDWRVQLEAGYVSDERLAQALFREVAQTGREVTNRVLFTRSAENDFATVELNVRAGDFTPNEYLLQSQGYTVDKYPEVSIGRVGFDLLPDRAPGLLAYSGETTISQMRLRFVDPKAEDFGFTTATSAQAAFGVDPEESLADGLRAQGFSEEPVTRFDTRHDVTAQLEAGDIRVTPFATGRFTAYDTDFGEFSPEEDGQQRLYGALGVRAATAVQRVYDGVESRLFGLHRLRHVVEPSATVFFSGSSLPSENLPIYDDDVEGLAEGTLINASIDQSFETKRGGPGRWRSEEILALRTELSWASEDADRESPIPRFYEARPELSNPGNALTNRLRYRPTNAVTIVGESVLDYDENRDIVSGIGLQLDQSPLLSWTADLRRIEPIDSTRLVLGTLYGLGDKYRARGTATFDADEEDFQSLSGVLERSFPNVVVLGSLRFNNITGQTSFGFTFEPRIGRTGGAGTSGLIDRLRPENRQ